MKSLYELIASLIKAKFHGELRIKFFSGEIRHIEKVESLDVSAFKNIPQT